MKTGKTNPIGRITAAIALVIAAAVFFSMTIMPAQAKTKYYLPSKMTEYTYKNGSFKKIHSVKFTYKKGYVQTAEYSHGAKVKLKYTYHKNGKLKKIKSPQTYYVTFNSKGRLKKFHDAEWDNTARYSGKRLVKYRQEGDWLKYSYAYYPNGAVKRIEERYIENADDVLADFYIELNKKGLITKTGGSAEQVTYNYKYTYDKKGRVSKVIVYNGKKKEAKYRFTYKKAKKTSAVSKHNAMINANVHQNMTPGALSAMSGGYGTAVRFIQYAY